jgi:hypothetical protein
VAAFDANGHWSEADDSAVGIVFLPKATWEIVRLAREHCRLTGRDTGEDDWSLLLLIETKRVVADGIRDGTLGGFLYSNSYFDLLLRQQDLSLILPVSIEKIYPNPNHSFL